MVDANQAWDLDCALCFEGRHADAVDVAALLQEQYSNGRAMLAAAVPGQSGDKNPYSAGRADGL
jgi:hypothetical protein